MTTFLRTTKQTGCVFLLMIALIFAPQTIPVARGTNLSELNSVQQRLIQDIDSHMNTQHTLKSRFIQLDGAGGFIEGSLYWRRPGKARFEYDPPSPLLLIATGLFLIEVDFELEQVTHYPQFSSIADYLLTDNMLQNSELEILEVKTINQAIRIRVRARDEPENGDIELVFDGITYDLLRWIVYSPDGNTTNVTLVSPQYNLALEDKLFQFTAPREWQTRNN